MLNPVCARRLKKSLQPRMWNILLLGISFLCTLLSAKSRDTRRNPIDTNIRDIGLFTTPFIILSRFRTNTRILPSLE